MTYQKKEGYQSLDPMAMEWGGSISFQYTTVNFPTGMRMVLRLYKWQIHSHPLQENGFQPHSVKSILTGVGEREGGTCWREEGERNTGGKNISFLSPSDLL